MNYREIIDFEQMLDHCKKINNFNKLHFLL